MNALDSLELLDKLAGRVHMTREDHVKARLAVEVIKTALNPKQGEPDARPE